MFYLLHVLPFSFYFIYFILLYRSFVPPCSDSPCGSSLSAGTLALGVLAWAQVLHTNTLPLRSPRSESQYEKSLKPTFFFYTLKSIPAFKPFHTPPAFAHNSTYNYYFVYLSFHVVALILQLTINAGRGTICK